LYNKGTALVEHVNPYDGEGYAKSTLEEAIKCYEKVIEIEPDNARAWHNKGLACIAVNRDDEGIMCLDRAVEIDPSWKETGEFS